MSRRLRIFSIERDQLLFILNARRFVALSARDGGYFLMPEVENLPPDAHVVDVRENPVTLCLDILVESETFDVVPPGHEVPSGSRFGMRGLSSLRSYRLVAEPDDSAKRPAGGAS